MSHASESLKWLVKMHRPESVDLEGKETEDLRICVSNMFPVNAEAVGSETTP